MISITDTGLEKNSLEENLEYVQAKIIEEKGPDVDLSPTGPWGQIASLLSKMLSDVDDQQEEIYLSRDPDNATGVAQDKLSAETGTYRKEATETVVQDVLLLGDEGTVIEEGRQVTQDPTYEPPSDLYFILTENITISKSSARKVVFSIDEPSTGVIYTVTINSVDYTYTALVTDGVPEVIAGLIAVLPSEVTGTNVDDELSIFGGDSNFTINNSSTLTMEELWAAGDFVANIAGPNAIPAGSLTEIVTPVSGWAEVTNPNSGITGLARETDAQLIIRRNNELIKGKSTDQAIRNAVAAVDSVTTASVTSNRTDAPVGSLPAHSFEVVVAGGTDDDIAQAIFENMPSGIQFYGTESGTAIDIDGTPFIINFSRPTNTYIWVRYTRTQHPEETYPDNGDAAVRENVLNWVEENIDIGTDVVRQRLETPFFEVPGSSAVVTEIAETASPGDTPSWGTPALISIGSSVEAVFADDRILIINP